MSVIVIQVGQCGNQLGEQLFTRLQLATTNPTPPNESSSAKPRSAATAGRNPSPFFCPVDNKARCILVDAEPKVVEGILERNPSLYRKDAAVCGQSGRGNNWGSGYHGLCGSRGSPTRSARGEGGDYRAFQFQKDQRESDNTLLPRVLCAVHTEAMRVQDGHLEGIVVLHSLAGGTGSGFTSKLIEKLREHFTHQPFDEEEYTDQEVANEQARRQARAMDRDGLSGMYGDRRKCMYIASIAVAPSLKGETTVQGINTTLTLRSLFAAADAIILLRNDEASAVGCHSLPEFNAFFVDALLLPMMHYGLKFGFIGELIARCCPDPRQKVLSLVPLPQRNYAKLRNCAILSRLYFTMKTPPTSSTSHPPPPCQVPLDGIHAPITRNLLEVASTTCYMGWPKGLLSTKATAKYLNGSMMVLNQVEELNRSLLFPLVKDCRLKVDANAFLHRFKDAGVSREYIADSVNAVASVLCYDDDCVS